ncbi:tRNA 2-thiouridine(34) synthase MnmA [bacterium endosymbiont of Pedicinus badii]|uniref:tRNA 2-thiouridine(34) synthase MnmA n=1 Tax=bacterium endosymbiont of Pedicinus badii TaxID=1719126 RepID=UPI0009D5C219|nr:tRNA 2-thiouridine(34) synthase MnmA [bacterium endosymbiont of Pedicinus badii]OQM34377.1 tRNA 2-thiouridylase [bacterium endosymbiont of Pedicinus badii]
MKKVVIGISGGVDSSIAAWMLKKIGYQVEAVFMQNWEEDQNCDSKKDFLISQMVCKKLGIPIEKINFSYEYWEKVFKKFILDYKSGYTPNPDILCNKEIKFKVFLNFAIEQLNANYIATGHYVRKLVIQNRTFLIKGKDQKKDQSYFLYSLNEKQISKCLFPIGHLKKKIVRKIAKNLRLINAKKKSSTGICFIGEKKFQNFIKKYIPKNPGKIVSSTGEELGLHNGLHLYTIGQRKGIRIGGKKGFQNFPWYVVKKDIKKNFLFVSQGKNNLDLFSKIIKIKNFHMINKNFFRLPIKCKAKIRYQQKEEKCILKKNKNTKSVYAVFKNPVYAATIGQSIVFYVKNCCIGGGIIQNNFKKLV